MTEPTQAAKNQASKTDQTTGTPAVLDVEGEGVRARLVTVRHLIAISKPAHTVYRLAIREAG